MILLHDLKLAIMTPPKCATNSLHAAFRQRPDMETYVGPSPAVESGYDRHTNIWPHEAKRYEKVIVVRDPLTRLVSLYLHWANRHAGYGRASLSFEGYAGLVATYTADFGEGCTAAMYGWNLTRWLRDVEYQHVLRVESLIEDLKPLGIVRESMPKINASYRGQEYEAFYTDQIRQAVGHWAAPDREKWYPPG